MKKKTIKKDYLIYFKPIIIQARNEVEAYKNAEVLLEANCIHIKNIEEVEY